jgi:hypothetical protein
MSRLLIAGASRRPRSTDRLLVFQVGEPPQIPSSARRKARTATVRCVSSKFVTLVSPERPSGDTDGLGRQGLKPRSIGLTLMGTTPPKPTPWTAGSGRRLSGRAQIEPGITPGSAFRFGWRDVHPAFVLPLLAELVG